MASTSSSHKPAPRVTLTEDWVVVLLGFGIIATVLYIVAPQAPAFGWKDQDELMHKVLSLANVGRMLIYLLIAAVCGVLAMWTTGKSVRHFLQAFVIVALLTWVALILAGHQVAKSLNLEAVIFSLLLGLLVSNTVGLPASLRAALSAELFVKIGLVLLGTSVIFGDLLRAGGLGLIQALVVVVAVWYFAYWLCKRMGLDDELTMMLSSAVSICGVSAAIATAGAIRGDNKKLSYVISLVLITAIPMMLLMPYAARQMGLSETVTGAWLGGSIDTTGAVVASGTMVGEQALTISTIVKFSQNVLLGLAAFAISVYWSYTGKTGDAKEKPTLAVIWERFPKFVIGFMAASLFFSFTLPSAAIASVKDVLKSIQTLWFALAFTSIGLETRFADLFHAGSRKPLVAFLVAQLFNIIITLLVAIALFQD